MNPSTARPIHVEIEGAKQMQNKAFDMEFSHVVFFLEMIGTVAFAVSGVMVARDRKMDIFGAVVLGCATAVGGGMIRDLILGITPPAMFTKPIYVLVAAITSIVMFFLEYIRLRFPVSGEANVCESIDNEFADDKSVTAESAAEESSEDECRKVKLSATSHRFLTRIASITDMAVNPERSDLLLNIADSIGLAAFVVVGCRSAIDHGYMNNLFLCSFVGVLTGIGGGILRDVFAGQMPLIMRKRVYGLAAIIGSVVYCELLAWQVDVIIASLACMIITCLIRFLAIHYRWNLPSFR